MRRVFDNVALDSVCCDGYDTVTFETRGFYTLKGTSELIHAKIQVSSDLELLQQLIVSKRVRIIVEVDEPA